jgi:hypothetical protein
MAISLWRDFEFVHIEICRHHARIAAAPVHGIEAMESNLVPPSLGLGFGDAVRTLETGACGISEGFETRLEVRFRTPGPGAGGRFHSHKLWTRAADEPISSVNYQKFPVLGHWLLVESVAPS